MEITTCLWFNGQARNLGTAKRSLSKFPAQIKQRLINIGNFLSQTAEAKASVDGSKIDLVFHGR